MKKFTSLFVLVFSISFSAISQNWVEFTASESVKPVYTVLTSNDTLVKFNVIVPGIFETPIDTFNRVNIKEHTKMDSVGYPEIPIVSFLVAIPECDGVNLKIELLDSTQFSGYNIYPAPELVPDTIEGGGIALVEEFAYNRAAYETDAMFPGTIAEAIDKGAIRAQHLVRVVLYPVQFNPVKDIIKAYSDFQITLTFNNPVGLINEDVGIFNEVVGNTLINYQSNGLNASVNCGAGLDNAGTWKWATNFPNDAIMDTCDYLLITDEYFFNEQASKDYIDSLARHRAEFNGFDVVMVKMIDIEDSINGINNKVRIRNLIKNTYDNGYANHTYDGKLAYVNLFGDVDLWNEQENIPTHYEDPDHGGYDVYFTWLTETNGNYDIYPDLMIGRCSVDTVTQVQNIVHKILNFEPDDLDYKYDMLTLATSADFYGIQSEVLMEMDQILPDYYNKELMLDPNFNQPYPSWDSIPYGLPPLLDSWAKGKMFVNYMGHGSPYNWSFGFQYGVLTQTHNNKLPFVLSCACFTGAFHNWDNCMAEQFLCQDSNRGAIGFFGSSIITVSSTFHFSHLYYNALIRNYSMVLGEAILESKLNIGNYLSDLGLTDYNLFGDPALNIFYENIDTIFPDLVVKQNEISITPEYPSVSEPLDIEFKVKNITTKDATEEFYISCFIIKLPENDSLWIGDTLLPGIDGYSYEILDFEIGADVLQPSSYKILIQIDTSNNIIELNEENNISSKETRVFSFITNLHIVNNFLDNSHPVSFDLNSTYNGNEIVFGDKIISSGGDVISEINMTTLGYTAIGNLFNDDELQVLRVGDDTVSTRILCTGIPSWSNSLNANYSRHKGPILFDFDSDGNEEVLLEEMDYSNSNFTSSLICYNSDSTERWIYNGSPTNSFFFAPVVLNNQLFDLIFIDWYGIVYFMKENTTNDSLIIVDTIQLPEDFYTISDPILGDLNKDNTSELIFLCTGDIYGKKIQIIDLESYNINYKEMNSNSYYSNPIVTDLNNDGYNEIVISENNVGLLVLGYSLDTIMFIEQPNLKVSELVSGDFDNDGTNDIVFQVQEENKYYMRICNSSAEELYNYPIFTSMENTWISDINNDSKNEILYSYLDELFVITLPNSGSSIGWPGQRGNVRNDGVIEHPAYFAPELDTVYWMNTISLSAEADNIIKQGSTVIIKPGTKIKAHSNSSLIVQGTLIAEGTERFPITFTADINYAEKGYWQGITAANGCDISMKHCNVKDAEIGVLFEDDNEVTFKFNYVENNLEGLAAFNSSPVIRENIITGNDIGLGSYNSAAPILTDLIQEQRFKNGIVNNETGIWINTSNLYIDNGYNDIYNIPAEGYYIQYFSTSFPPLTILARNNYWGSIDINEIKTHLSSNISIKPYCTSPQSAYDPESDEKSEMLKTAIIALNSEDFTTAATTYQTIITQFPESEEAYVSVSGLFECTGKANGNWDDLNDYYAGLYNDSTYSEAFKKLVFGNINLCNRKLGYYSEAIANYESIILNDPTYSDSIFAVIDIGNTYEEAGNYKSTLGQLSELVPESRKKHVEKTIDLLLSLKSSVNEVTNDLSNKSKVLGVYPNPLKDKTTIKIYNSQKSEVVVKVYDVTGREILNLNYGFKEKGEFTIELSLSGLMPGVYYGAVEIDNHTEDVINLIKL